MFLQDPADRWIRVKRLNEVHGHMQYTFMQISYHVYGGEVSI